MTVLPARGAPDLLEGRFRPINESTFRQLGFVNYAVRQDLFLCPAVVRRFSIRVAPGLRYKRLTLS
jgi:hypothetical protein